MESDRYSVERGEAEEEGGVDLVTFGDSGEYHVISTVSCDYSRCLSSLLMVVLISSPLSLIP